MPRWLIPPVYLAVSFGMTACTAIVFSISFLFVQYSATAYSKRFIVMVAPHEFDRVGQNLAEALASTLYFQTPLAPMPQVSRRLRATSSMLPLTI